MLVITIVVAAVFPAFVVIIVASDREYAPTIAALTVVIVARFRFFQAGGVVDAAVAADGTTVMIGVTGAAANRPPRRSRTRAMLVIIPPVLRSGSVVRAFSKRARPCEALVAAWRATMRVHVVGDLILPTTIAAASTTTANTNTNTTTTVTNASSVVGPTRPVFSRYSWRGTRRQVSGSIFRYYGVGFPLASAPTPAFHTPNLLTFYVSAFASIFLQTCTSSSGFDAGATITPHL